MVRGGGEQRRDRQGHNLPQCWRQLRQPAGGRGSPGLLPTGWLGSELCVEADAAAAGRW